MTREERYIRQVARLYGVTVDEIVAATRRITLSPDDVFSFNDFPSLKGASDKIFDNFSKSLLVIINAATENEWKKACKNADAVIERFMRTTRIPENRFEGYGKQNLRALSAFQNRKINGMNLSNRIWQYTEQLRQEMELALDIGIGEGLSAAQLSRDVRQYLKEPDKLFRRVRDKHGDLQLSKAAKTYNPGERRPGVYRSSYKNAMRMIRTEINMAYRSAENMRWQQLDFVVGFEVKLSNNHRIADICDELIGKYPKDFKFVGWHPQCRCFAIPIMMTPEEMIELSKMSAEERARYKSLNAVDDVPENFKKWVQDNADRIEKANNRGTLPYFLKDNATFAEISVKDINLENRAEYIKEARAIYNAYDTQIWTKEYFDEYSGGFNVYHIEHEFSETGDGGNAEKKVGKMLAKYNGKQVEFLPEGGSKKPDMKFDNQTWEVKFINNANAKTIRSYIEHSRKKETNNCIFYWDDNSKLFEINEALMREIGKLEKLGRVNEMPNIYYMDKNGLLKLFWKNKRD